MITLAARVLPSLLVLVLTSMIACAGSKPGDTGDTPPADSAADDGAPSPGDDKVCEADVDCVPAQCCHPTSCVPAAQAPDCSDIACTQDCQAGTMDCGQGHCACADGTCTAVIEDLD